MCVRGNKCARSVFNKQLIDGGLNERKLFFTQNTGNVFVLHILFLFEHKLDFAMSDFLLYSEIRNTLEHNTHTLKSTILYRKTEYNFRHCCHMTMVNCIPKLQCYHQCFKCDKKIRSSRSVF